MRSLIFVLLLAVAALSQDPPPIEPGVSQDLAKWRAAHYSDVRYKLNLTLEKMSPVLKGSMEIRVRVERPSRGGPSANVVVVEGVDVPGSVPPPPLVLNDTPIILDWRKIAGHEKDSTITNVVINGSSAWSSGFSRPTSESKPPEGGTPSLFEETNEHLIFRNGVVAGENVIKLDFTSPILTSGSAITRYIDKEDGSEYIYSLFVPSDASTAFPVFDQPDLKARFKLTLDTADEWPTSNAKISSSVKVGKTRTFFYETKPISTYVFAFATGPFVDFDGMFVRKSQAAKFKPHEAEVRRLNREGIKFLEQYFDYKFPFPKYDIVLIPEFPFGGMEHAGATFLRESSVIFPTEPTASDYISRANVIFHEAAHQWFGDTVTMRWFDDLWLKEGFAEFMAYKTLEKVMPEYNAWKTFYERNKQAAYATDSTRGTTPIYQPIKNLSAAKSAYGNIVYRKAPSFLRQAEFYLGPDKFQTAVRAFLKKHEYANAGWEDLVKEFEDVGWRRPTDCFSVEECKQAELLERQQIQNWASIWVKLRGLATVRTEWGGGTERRCYTQSSSLDSMNSWPLSFLVLKGQRSVSSDVERVNLSIYGPDNPAYSRPLTTIMRPGNAGICLQESHPSSYSYIFPNYQDYGYGIFLLDDKSRDYVLKNIQNEKDPFLRSMMWGALWDSVREAELDPREYVELAIRALSPGFSRPAANKRPPKGGTPSAPAETDETIIQSLLSRVSTAMNYYLPDAQRNAIAPRFEAVLLDRLQNAPTAGQRVTFFRAFVSNASSEKARVVLKEMLRSAGVPPAVLRASRPQTEAAAGRHPDGRRDAGATPLRAKDKFDIVTRLIILNDPEAQKLLATLEKTETSDDAKRYAYAAKAAFGTKQNKEKFWNDFVSNKDISESWIEAAINPFNNIRHADLTQPYLERALKELPNLKRTRKIFFINNWLAAFMGGQRDEKALAIVNKLLADNPNLDNDLRLKILENVDLIERAVKIRSKW